MNKTSILGNQFNVLAAEVYDIQISTTTTTTKHCDHRNDFMAFTGGHEIWYVFKRLLGNLGEFAYIHVCHCLPFVVIPESSYQRQA